jgi:TIR domain
MAKRRRPKSAPQKKHLTLPREVFVSHSAKNRKFVDQLAAVLRAHGISFWLSRKHLLGAQQWHDEIGAALDRCDWFIVVLSKQSVKSEWVKRELVRALNDRKFRDRIVPIRFQQCDFDRLSWTLEQMQIVDFSVDVKAGFHELLRIWGIE